MNEYQLTTSSNSFCKYRLPYLMNYYIATAIPSPSLDADTFHRKQCKNWVNKSIVLLFVCYYAWFPKHAIFTLYQYGMYIAIMLAHKTLTRKETIMRVQLCIEVITFDVENYFILSL